MHLHLHEEYIRRKQLPVPVIKSAAVTDVMLKTANGTYRAFTIHWLPGGAHPGKFLFREIEPALDCDGLAGHGLAVRFERHYHADTYEQGIAEAVARFKESGDRAVQPHDWELASWHMFVISMGSRLMQSASSEVLRTIVDSVSDDLGPLIRHRSMRLAKRFLMYDSHLRKHWANFQDLVQTSETRWLVDLINA